MVFGGIKRCVPAFLFGVVALIAYLHVKTVGKLLEGKLLGIHPFETPQPRAGSGLAPVPDEAAFVRSSFVPNAEIRTSVADVTGGAGDPLTAPACRGIVASITTESDDASWSAAALRTTGEPSGQLRRVGDQVGDKIVSFIGFNPRAGSPAVWLSKGSALCQVLLFYPEPFQTGDQTTPTERSPSSVPREIATRIQKLSDSEFKIDRRAVDAILEDQSALMNGVRVSPERRDGKTVGLRLLNIKEKSLLAELGLKSGDRIETINGFSVANPEKALEAYARLRVAPKLDLVLNRRGAPFEIQYRVE